MNVIKTVCFILFLAVFRFSAFSSEEEIKKNTGSSKLLWEPVEIQRDQIEWQVDKSTKTIDNEYINSNSNYRNFSNSSKYFVRSVGKGVSINNTIYPDLSSYVPNAYLDDPSINGVFSIRGISRVRKPNCNTVEATVCADAVVDMDFPIFNDDQKSFNLKWSVQSLTGRENGTKFGEAQGLGFKSAFQVSEQWSVAFGGENIIHLDDRIDLGRNFYLIASSYQPVSLFNLDSLLFFTAGVGTDFFGYRGNGFIGKVNCFGKPNLTGDGTTQCQVGPIGSISIAFNERIAFINEWFGYGFGSGFSFIPIKNIPLSFSILATDYLGNFPSYIKENCIDHNSCETRFYGNVRYSF